MAETSQLNKTPSSNYGSAQTERVNDPIQQNKQEPQAPTSLPMRQIAILWYLQLCEPVANTVIYPFVNELVGNLSIIGGDRRKIGYYVGIIESVFFLTECLCVLQWGRLSDLIGRRPVILVGLLGVTLSISCFGFSRTFTTLVLSRSLSGLTNGNIGVIKSTIGELSDATNVMQAFQYMPLCWPIGETIGPLIGGYLANPSERFPSVFGNSPFWHTFPYLLPCLVAALFPLSGLIVSALFLHETVPYPWRWKAWRNGKSRISDAEVAPPPPYKRARSPSVRSVMTRRVVVTVINYSILALVNISYCVLQPLYLSAPIGLGGLGLHPTYIGYVLGAQGVLGALSVFCLSSRLQRSLGAKATFTLAMASFLVLIPAFPTMNALAVGTTNENEMRWEVWAILCVQIALLGLVNVGYGCIFILVTKSSPSRAYLGSTNGLAQTAASLMRAIGPASATALFAVSIEKQLLGGRLVYIVLLLLAGSGVALSTLLDDSPMAASCVENGEEECP